MPRASAEMRSLAGSLPAEGERNLGLALDQVEGLEVAPDRLVTRAGSIAALEAHVGLAAPAGSCAAGAWPGSRCRPCCPRAARCIRGADRGGADALARGSSGLGGKLPAAMSGRRELRVPTRAEVAKSRSSRRKRIRPRRPRTSRAMPSTGSSGSGATTLDLRCAGAPVSA
jgi:hypothetical protein